MIFRLSLLLIFAVTLSSCGSLIDKNIVKENILRDQHGEKIYVYDECNPMHVFKKNPLCYREFVNPKYCYHSLGKIACYNEPLRGREEVRRVK